MNVEFYRTLIPDCERLNIRVCAENMWQWDDKREIIVDSICAQPEEFCALLDAIDSPWIVGCLDIGHSALVGGSLRTLSARWAASACKRCTSTM